MNRHSDEQFVKQRQIAMFNPKDYDIGMAYCKEQETRAENGRLANEVRKKPNLLIRLVQYIRTIRIRSTKLEQELDKARQVPQWEKDRVAS